MTDIIRKDSFIGKIINREQTQKPKDEKIEEITDWTAEKFYGFTQGVEVLAVYRDVDCKKVYLRYKSRD